jgi:CheY-like chemotaxis protein
MKHILFVDDDPAMFPYVEYLELDGYTVEFVNSDSEAIDELVANKRHFDVVILDIMMPSRKYSRDQTDQYHGTGLRLAENLRVTYPTLPIILLSIRVDSEVQEFASRNGIQALMRKEMTSPARLAQQVQSIVGD